MKHFSHEHPLKLKKNVVRKTKTTCDGCLKPISKEETAYACEECSSSEDYFLLHIECANLPREIIHPKHDQHSLFLLHRSALPDTRHARYICYACNADIEDGFLYKCKVIGDAFQVHLACALKEIKETIWDFNKEGMMKHEGHEHSLRFHPRVALTYCFACSSKDEDLFYTCTECPFVMHKRCASLPVRAKYEKDEHDLFLSYTGIPLDRRYLWECHICKKRIFDPTQWVYCCRLCRQVVHLKCFREYDPNKQSEANLDLLLDDDSKQKLANVLQEDGDLLRFPSPDAFENMIKRFFLKNNSPSEIRKEIKHRTHPHPLILKETSRQDPPEDIEEDEEIICNCCIDPIILSSYYSCVQCNYHLHIHCTNIPRLPLQHPSHPHPLIKFNFKNFYSIFRCNLCKSECNGFFFKCETCKFYLDVKCAALPTVIQHQNHNHPLFFQSQAPPKKGCKACKSKIDGLSFGCKPCDYHLELDCAMLPWAVRHRFDKHPIPLRFPPYGDHPEDLICDICEEEMHPGHWCYLCTRTTQCFTSFHPRCISQARCTHKIKFGDILRVMSIHPHPLHFKEDASYKSSCDSCSQDLSSDYVFECEECNFCLCRACVRNIQ